MEFDRIISWLNSNSSIKKPLQHDIDLKPGTVFYGSGDPITGIVKFLGYHDETYNIANFPSISFNTDFSRALSACVYSEVKGSDRVIMDGISDEKYTSRAIKALSIFKDTYGIKGSFHFYIRRERRYGEAKGLGESAAIAAATARSIARCAFRDDAVNDTPFVSSIARLVSGSGSRSVSGGVSFWKSWRGIPPSESYAFRLPVDTSHFFFAAIPLMADYRTESAHHAAIKSPFYRAWETYQIDLIGRLIDDQFSLKSIMSSAEEDTRIMHAVLMSAGDIVISRESISVLNAIREFRKKYDGIYYSMDTGPSIVLMSEEKNIIEMFLSQFGFTHIWGEIPEVNWNNVPERFIEEAEGYFANSTKGNA